MNVWKRVGRAAEIAACFLGVYSFIGLVILGTVFANLDQSGDLGGIIVGIHLLSAVALWPSATVLSLLLQKWLLPPRGLAVCLSGVAAVPVVWIGTLLCAYLPNGLFRGMHEVLGWQAELVVYFGWAVLFSNLTLAIAWISGSRSTRV